MKCRSFLKSCIASAAVFTVLAFTNNNHAAAQRIAWVSFHPGDNTPSAAAAGAGFSAAPDVEYTRLLQAAGHTVTRYVTTATPDTNFLNGFDLVIISRSVPSSNYDTVESTALWHSLTKPTIVLGAFVMRASRLGYTDGETTIDTTGPIRLAVTDPAHPIFTGVPLDANNAMVNIFADRVTHNGVLQTGISVNDATPAFGGTILATVATETDPTFGRFIVAEYPAGTVMANELADTTAAKRLVLLTGSRENQITAEGAGVFDLSVDGARLFLNAVHYMTGQPTTEPPPLIANLRPASGTREHLAELGLSFSASSGTAAGIPTTNITLTLNSTNVPAEQLFISGTPQARTVAFSNLVAGVQYTGVITVRDAGGREVSQNFTFDTLDPVALPTSFAFPVSAAGADGMRMRIVQGPSAPVFANTEARAVSQLAGTFIDPGTLEPAFNEATPSTDNPDGSYNIETVNFSVESGLALERGNFRDPTHPDQPFPGTTHAINIAAEIVTYLELQPGRYYMGVNSDDGFAVYSGPNGRDLFAMNLGRFDGGRGSTDSIFQFRITQAGLYPFRLVYYQGDGQGAVEWFFMNPLTNEKILINDPANSNAINAVRQVTGGERPYISSVSPANNALNVPVTAPIIIKVEEPAATIQAGSIQLQVNGQTVTPQVNKAGTTTTITYDPAQDLPGETTNRVQLSFTDSASGQRTATFQFVTEYVPPVVDGANIVWVSVHAADNEPSGAAATAGFTNAADIEYTRLLTNAGHTVTRYVSTAAPDIQYLHGFDLVIISRSNPSGNFSGAGSTAWHSLTNPTIHLGGYALRMNRMGFYSGDTIPDVNSASVRLNVKDPSHPIFEGINLDGSSNMVSSYAHLVTWNGVVQRGISVNNNAIAPGGKVLATVGTAGDAAVNGTVISEFPAGTAMRNTQVDVTAGHRLVFLTGSREQATPTLTGDGAGIFDLDPDGAKMFLNAVSYMAGLTSATPDDVAISASRNSSGDLVISWPAEGSTGYVLQGTESLGTPNWQSAGGTPTSNGGTLSQTVPTSGTMRFFRLVRP
ncbi:MAG TPA: Ig-like domain-containing protein [Verrucomicrobiae bacterium]